MSQSFFKNLERLSNVDTGFGVLPIVYSICKIADNLNPKRADLIHLVRHSRWLMALEETYFSIYSDGAKTINLNCITRPESIFFRASIPSNIRTGLTHEIGDELVSEKQLKSFKRIDQKKGQYQSEKMDSKNNFLRELFSNFSKPRTQINDLKFEGVIPDAFANNIHDKEKERKQIMKQIKYTLCLIENLFDAQLVTSSATLVPAFKEIASDFSNEIHIPLAGLFRISQSEPHYVMYMLSIFEYRGKPRKIEEFHNLISNYMQEVFEKNEKLTENLAQIRRLNNSDMVGNNCFGKVLVAHPVGKEIKPPEFLCAITLFGFNPRLATNGGFAETPLHSLMYDYFYPYKKKEQWKVYCPNIGISVNIPLGGKKNE